MTYHTHSHSLSAQLKVKKINKKSQQEVLSLLAMLLMMGDKSLCSSALSSAQVLMFLDILFTNSEVMIISQGQSVYADVLYFTWSKN